LDLMFAEEDLSLILYPDVMQHCIPGKG